MTINTDTGHIIDVSGIKNARDSGNTKFRDMVFLDVQEFDHIPGKLGNGTDLLS